MSLQRYGRWVRVEAASASGRVRLRVINLDQVSSFYDGPHGASFAMADGDIWDTTEPFEDACLMVMVADTPREPTRPEPTPPIPRNQIPMFSERAS